MPQVIVVSLRGSGTQLLNQATSALGFTSYGTMSGSPLEEEQPAPGETYPVLLAGYGQHEAVRLLKFKGHALQEAFQEAVSALWRVWWMRLGQPVTHASPIEPALEARLARIPSQDLYGLLPGRGCWYLTGLDLARADADFLRHWQSGGHPRIVFHHRDLRDRIIDQIHLLSRPVDAVGSMPEHLVYHSILAALPTLDAKITLALSDPNFPGMDEARRSSWLLHHPAVCVITHEDLAGPALGGTTAARDQALARLHAAITDSDPLPAWPAPSTTTATNPGTGPLAVGAWRTYFTPAHERLLEQHHSSLLPPSHHPAAPPALPATRTPAR
ncbi:hypothetical protein OG432_00065 [Streptomyces sp. NBC_00442]|uniref:hypothetical protein n=1 Tax=Streptomyces sp. NBC_00442 TaxID=2903651 RepID=UPI002E233067